MRSMFVAAPFQRFDLGRHLLLNQSLGQMVDPYFSQAERDKWLIDIQSAQSKVKPIEDLFAWSADNDPGLIKYLGNDAARFRALSTSIAPLYPTVRDLGDRLAQSDAEYWYRPTDQEIAQVKQWVTGVTEMYKIYQGHKALPYTAAPGTKLPPVTVPMPTGPSAPGISTQDLLIGGGVIAGLGVLALLFS